MANKSAVVEIQHMFRRQARPNTVFDIFLPIFLGDDASVHKGKLISDAQVMLLTPSRTPHSDRYFSGTELGNSFVDGYNDRYGVLALAAELYSMTERRSIGREIARAFVKRCIEVSADYIKNHEGLISVYPATVPHPHRSDFYRRTLDLNQIQKHIRKKTKERIRAINGRQRRQGYRKNYKQDIDIKILLAVCNNNGLAPVAELACKLNALDDANERRKSMLGLGRYLLFQWKFVEKGFYKELEAIFCQ